MGGTESSQSAACGKKLGIAAPPNWVDIRQTELVRDLSLERLDEGEGAAIALAVQLHAELLLMDDEEGVIAARRKGLIVTGTLGVLTRAAQRQFLDLAEAFDRLKRNQFPVPPGNHGSVPGGTETLVMRGIEIGSAQCMLHRARSRIKASPIIAAL